VTEKSNITFVQRAKGGMGDRVSHAEQWDDVVCLPRRKLFIPKSQ
jgi:hypothetical protein